MDSNEEYLDQLLRSLTEGTSDAAAGGADDSDQDDGLGDLLNQFSDDDAVPQELFSGLLGGAEDVPVEQEPVAQQAVPADGMRQPEDDSVQPEDNATDAPGEPEGSGAEESAEPESGVAEGPAEPESGEMEPAEPENGGAEEPTEPEGGDAEGSAESENDDADLSEAFVFDAPEQETYEERSELSESEPEEQPESDMAWETEFDMFKDPESDASETPESGIDETQEPDMPVFAEPESSVQPESAGQDEDDLSSLLESLGEDGQEISDLLDKAESDEPVVDMVDSLMQELNEELSPDARYAQSGMMAGLPERPGKKRKKEKKEKVRKEKVKKEKVKKERVKKEKKSRRRKGKEPIGQVPGEGTEVIFVNGAEVEVTDDVDSAVESIMANITGETDAETAGQFEPQEKKQGFWSRLLNALTQEDEDEGGEEPAELISDENGAILEELDKEKKQAKGKKKKGKDKGKDKDKGKKAAETDEDEESEESAAGKGKKKKEKKPKKEKPPVPVEDLLPGKKLSLKKVLPLVLVVTVFGLAYILVSHLYIDYVNKQAAEKAYYAEDYMECYTLLFGKDLDDNQELMYHRSELALQMERMKGNYRRLVMEGKELEALDYLVQCVRRKETIYIQGQKWNCMDIVEETYRGMIDLMTANYGLSEERALEIAALKSDVDYTLALMEALEKANGSSEDEAEQETPISYEDRLPEEDEDPDTAFVDTMG